MIKIAKRLSESLETGKPLEEAKASGKFGHKRKDIKRGTYVIIRRTGAIGKVTKVWPSGVRERAVYMVRRVDRVPPGKKLGAQSMHFEEELMPTDPPPVTEGFKDWMLGLTIAGAGIGMTGCSNETPNKPDAQAKTEKFQDYRERVSKLTPKQRADEWKKRIGKRQAQDEIKKTGHTKATSNKTPSDDAAGFLDEALEAPDNDEDRFGNDNFCISLGNGMSSFDPGYWGIHICGKRHEHSDLSEFRRKLQYLTFDELDRYLLSYGEQGGDRPRDFQVWCKTREDVENGLRYIEQEFDFDTITEALEAPDNDEDQFSQRIFEIILSDGPLDDCRWQISSQGGSIAEAARNLADERRNQHRSWPVLATLTSNVLNGTDAAWCEDEDELQRQIEWWNSLLESKVLPQLECYV